jgi:hypothetical protein
MVAAATGDIPASPKSEGTKYCLDTFSADVFNALRSATIDASSSAQGIGVRLASNDLDLDSAQQLLAFLESWSETMADRALTRHKAIAISLLRMHLEVKLAPLLESK